MAWQAPQPFARVVVGNPQMVDVILGATNRQLKIIMKPLDEKTNPVRGTTNILLLDANGNEVRNVLVTNRGFRHELARSATGTWQVYRKP